MKQLTVLLSAGLLASLSTYGQQADQKMLPGGSGGLNPSIGNLASPSLFDGSANVNIPIFDYGSFGISLSYNTKGVTVDELSGPVGTHWNLNAGGVIQRAVKDLPDEINQIYTASSSNGGATKKVKGRFIQYGLTTPASDEYWDNANDEFQVSAGDLQFSFMLGKNGYVLTYPQNNCRITPLSELNAPFTGFRISDEQGNNYYFRTRDDVSTGYLPFGADGQKPYYYVAKWFLDSVVLGNGQRIRYEYQAVQYPASTTSGNDPIDLYKTSTRLENNSGSAVLQPWGYVSLNDLGNWTYILRKIYYPGNVTASFVFDQTAVEDDPCMRSVKQIEIAQEDNCLKYRFNKVYFGHSTTDNVTLAEYPFNGECNYNPFDKRLMLKSIQKLSCDESRSEPYYSFEYSNTSPPFRWGNNRDYFAYCNSVVTVDGAGYLNNFFNQIPTHNQAFSNLGPLSSTNKDNTTNASIMAALCLTKVKNAYGGAVSFQYEVHTGLVSVTDNIAGSPPATDPLFLGKNANDGLRLASMTTEDSYHPGSKQISVYSYNGGQRFLNGGYFSYPTKQDAYGNPTEYAVTNNWISAHQLVNGSNHGYSQVTVTNTDASGNMLSKESHYFTNFREDNVLNYFVAETYNGSNKHWFQFPYTDKQYIKTYRIGLPKKTETFDANNRITSRTVNTYGFAEDFSSSVSGLGNNSNIMRAEKNNVKPNIFTSFTDLATDNFVPFTGKTLLLSTVQDKFINDNVAVNDVVNYTYDSRNNLSTTTTTNSKGEQFALKYLYN